MHRPPSPVAGIFYQLWWDLPAIKQSDSSSFLPGSTVSGQWCLWESGGGRQELGISNGTTEWATPLRFQLTLNFVLTRPHGYQLTPAKPRCYKWLIQDLKWCIIEMLTKTKRNNISDFFNILIVLELGSDYSIGARVWSCCHFKSTAIEEQTNLAMLRIEFSMIYSCIFKGAGFSF